MTANTGHDSTATAQLEPTDAHLVMRARADDATAFAQLVRRHYRAAYVVALALMRNRADAEDVCHDAFIRAATHLEECRQPDRFAHWLLVIVRNHARNVHGRETVRQAAPLEPGLADSHEDVARNSDRARLRGRLEQALAQLDPHQREVLLLHDLEGWTHDDIAEAAGISAVNSRQQLFRARRRLRELLGPGLLREYFHG